MRDALFEAVAAHAVGDERLVIYGEENRDWDGAFGVYRGLTELLPYHRLFNAPISEAAIVGTAVGYAMSGGRALVELMYADFMGRAGDELFNQLAKWQAMSGGTIELPVVVRVSVGRRYGAQHSQDWSSLVHHVPGLKVAYPATPFDAKGLLATALSGSDPVVFLESQQLYEQTEVVHPQVPREYYRVPFGQPHRAREGSDLTIVAVGPALYRALAAADRLLAQYGVSAAVFDPRTIVPLDASSIVDSVLDTGRLLCVADAVERGSWLHTLAGHVTEQAFARLRAAPVVLGTPNWITPPAELEDVFFPGADTILDAVHTRLLPLTGHRPTRPPVDRGRLMALGR
jgi:2-oxoisovalerate dehydrogenase E1 component